MRTAAKPTQSVLRIGITDADLARRPNSLCKSCPLGEWRV